MKLHKWKDVQKEQLSAEEIAESKAWAKREAEAIELRALRKLAGKTQTEVAQVLETTQAQLSMLESRSDHRVSTLRRYVQALGGELELVAHFGPKSIAIRAALPDVEVVADADRPRRRGKGQRAKSAAH